MLALPRIGPVPTVRATLPVGPGTGQGPQPGDVIWLQLAGPPGGERHLRGQDGRPLRLLLAGGLPPELARLPAGTPLAWTVLGISPQLTLGLRVQGKAPAAEPPLPAAAPPEADPPRSPADAVLRPEAQLLRQHHALSAEATGLAERWRQRVLAGLATSPDRRSAWRREAAAGRWPWSLLALADDARPEALEEHIGGAALPSCADAARWQFELTEAGPRLGMLLVEPDVLLSSPPQHEHEPGSNHGLRMRALALRLLLDLPGLGLLVLHLQFTRGGHGMALRLAAANPEALETLRRCLPTLAQALGRLDLVLQHCQLDLQGPRLRPWSHPAQRLQADRLPPLLFRAAAELVLCLRQATAPVKPAPASAVQARPLSPANRRC